MSGLKKEGLIANDRLTRHLAKFGYTLSTKTTALWSHATHNISFSLGVDDFGMKYVGKNNANHLIAALRELYTVSTNWKGILFCGLTLNWNCNAGWVDVSMMGYVAAALHKFQHPPPTKKQDAPHPWNRPIYGAHTQYATPDDDSPLLPSATINQAEHSFGTFMYYGLDVKPIMIVALGDLSSQQAKAIAKTYDKVIWFLNYATTHPEDIIWYHSIVMILHVHINAFYLSTPRVRSRTGGHYILTDPFNDTTTLPKPNGPVQSVSKIMENVMEYAAEAKIGAAYINGQEAIPILTTLQ